jgi:hypothetical protein
METARDLLVSVAENGKLCRALEDRKRETNGSKRELNRFLILLKAFDLQLHRE